MIDGFALKIVVGLCVIGAVHLCQSQTSTTETEVWPEVDAHVQLPRNFRVLSFAGLEQGVGYPYQQVYAAAALGYQMMTILRLHLTNIDPDKERYFVIGGGYEYLHTTQSGKVTDENRLDFDAIFNYRPSARFLLQDRNRGEFRWVNGVYSTTYRNRLLLERDFLVNGFRFSPYGAAEVFYDGNKHSWNQEWYTAGVEWPYKQIFMINTYYLREHCDDCKPTNWNAAGVTLNFFFGKRS
jgi:Protein of unknown function (DUF2490)